MDFLSEINFIISNKKIGRRGYFGWKDENLQLCLIWALRFGYLFVSKEGEKIKGIGIAYPIERDCKCMEDLYVFGNIVKAEDEQNKSLFILDWLAIDTEARKDLVYQFKTRFSNWENQKKYGIQFNKLKLLSNRYINLLHKI